RMRWRADFSFSRSKRSVASLSASRSRPIVRSTAWRTSPPRFLNFMGPPRARDSNPPSLLRAVELDHEVGLAPLLAEDQAHAPRAPGAGRRPVRAARRAPRPTGAPRRVAAPDRVAAALSGARGARR